MQMMIVHKCARSYSHQQIKKNVSNKPPKTSETTIPYDASIEKLFRLLQKMNISIYNKIFNKI